MSEPEPTGTPAVESTSEWGMALPMRDLTGATLGDFHVERLLGRGGMGEVYLARQLSLNRPVALKVLRPDLLTRSNYLQRFEAEAAAVAKLNHPNIVHVYTLGSVDAVRFIAMEYVQGTNLKEYLRKKGALDYPLALSIMRQAALAVGAAGEIGLIHRDIKPENLLLTRKGQVKVADFGLCRDLDSNRVSVTQTGITMGTPLYMSPEQAQGHAIDHRSDLYSLGVTFYHMIAGVPPFKADTALALALKHVKDRPASLAVHRPDVPPELDRLVLKLMAKVPSERYQSAAEMLRDLGKVREALNSPSVVQPASDVSGFESQTNAPAAVSAPQASATATESQTRRTLWMPSADGSGLGKKAGGALVSLALGLGLLAGWWGRSEDLLTGAPRPAKSMPGLWLDPGWSRRARENSPEEQYRVAQLRTPRDAQDAAWLAVPGFFPSSREWSVRAYTQLTRLLLQRGDAERLEALASDIEGWDGAQTHEKELAAVARAGVDAVRGDVDGVLSRFDRDDPRKLTDPALMELSLEVADQAERAARRDGATSNPATVKGRLVGVQAELMRKLLLSEPRDLGPDFARRP